MFYIDIETKKIHLEGSTGPKDQPFSTEALLLEIADEQKWSKEDVTGIWNSFAGTPGFTDCKRLIMFRNRPYGVKQIWKAIQRLAKVDVGLVGPPAQREPNKRVAPPKRAKAVAKKAKPAEPKAGSKKAEAIRLLQRERGVSGTELQEAFGWQAHTVRGFLATMRSKGFAMTAEKDEKRGMVYKAA
jgi:hypothetical protein